MPQPNDKGAQEEIKMGLVNIWKSLSHTSSGVGGKRYFLLLSKDLIPLSLEEVTHYTVVVDSEILGWI